MSSEKKDTPRWMLRNSKGERDAMWTLTFIAFLVTTFAYAVSILHAVQVGDVVVSFRAFDGLGYAAVVLVPLLGAYFGRRYTKESNETSMAKAQIYAEVAKRKLEVATPGPITAQPTVKIDPNKVADQIHEEAEAELHEELVEPADEV